MKVYFCNVSRILPETRVEHGILVFDTCHSAKIFFRHIHRVSDTLNSLVVVYNHVYYDYLCYPHIIIIKTGELLSEHNPTTAYPQCGFRISHIPHIAHTVFPTNYRANSNPRLFRALDIGTKLTRNVTYRSVSSSFSAFITPDFTQPPSWAFHFHIVFASFAKNLAMFLSYVFVFVLCILDFYVDLKKKYGRANSR